MAKIYAMADYRRIDWEFVVKMFRKMTRFRKRVVKVPPEQSPTGQLLMLRYVRMDQDYLTLHRPGHGYLKVALLSQVPPSTEPRTVHEFDLDPGTEVK